MKKHMKAIGKAALYWLLYFGVQLLVSLIITTVVMTVYLVMSGETDVTIVEQEVLKYTTVIVLISNILSLLFVWLLFVLRNKKFANEVQLHKCSTKQIVAVVIFGLTFSHVYNWLFALIPFPKSLLESFTASHDMLYIGNPIVNFISVAILAPIAEEVFFRGLIYTRLQSSMPISVAAILSAIVFGLMHGEVVWILFAFIMGLVLVWVFEQTKSLLACIIVHVINNSIAQLMVIEFSLGMQLVILFLNIVLLVGSVIYIIRENNCRRERRNVEEI